MEYSWYIQQELAKLPDDTVVTVKLLKAIMLKADLVKQEQEHKMNEMEVG
jgi:hypothetical protein